MSHYFPKLYEPFGGDIDIRVYLFNYATKTDIKNIPHIDTSSFALHNNVVVFITGNLKNCLMKELILLKHLIMELLHTYVITILLTQG